MFKGIHSPSDRKPYTRPYLLKDSATFSSVELETQVSMGELLGDILDSVNREFNTFSKLLTMRNFVQFFW